MDAVTDVFIFVSLAGIAGYVLAYGCLTPWWRSAAGRTMFSLGVVLFAISALAATSAVFGLDYELRPVVRLCVWGATALVNVGLLIAWIRAQRRP